MPTERREFAVDDLALPMPDALRMIRAALEDEGLTLGPRSGPDVVTSVVAAGVKTFYVPTSRIVTVEEDEAMRAALQAQRARREERASAV